jgi:plastocyanin
MFRIGGVLALRLVTLGALTAALLAMPWPVAADTTISIKNFAYGPSTIQVRLGEPVTWINDEEIMPHDVTSGSPGRGGVGEIFASAIMAPGESFSWTFYDAGEYAYVCALHPSMTGVVIVTAE